MTKVLIVDDNEDNRIVLRRMLNHGGYEVVTASNGSEALATARGVRPDLVLMDLAMPEMDGWAATARMKAEQELKDIPVIVVTGHVTGDEILRAQQVGCHDVVSKPIDYYVLMDKLKDYVQPEKESPTAA